MLVSIVIPYYKDKKNIESSVISALKQTYKNIEILIIDNENSLISKNILNTISKKSKKIKIFSNKKKYNYAGIGRNLGIKKSKGEFIAFLDSDDYWHKDKIKLQLKKSLKENIDILFTSFKALNENKRIVYKVNPPKKLTFADLVKSCPVCCSSAMIRKRCLKKIKFNNYKTKEDYELWLKLSIAGFNIQTLNRYLTNYNVRNSSLSSFHLNKLQNAFLIYYKSLNFKFHYSIYCVIRLYYNALKKKFYSKKRF